MLIIDSHLDLAWNALQWNRDLRRSAYTLRALEHHVPGKGRAQGTVALPELAQGRVALSFATLLARATGHPTPHLDYPSPEQAYGIAHGQLAYYRALEHEGYVRIIEDRAGLDAHWDQWEEWDEAGRSAEEIGARRRVAPPLGFVIAAEGLDFVLEPAQLEAWWRSGLRVAGLTHYGPGRYAGGTGTELGLTDLGGPLLSEMERLGMVLDMTHFSDQAFWEAMERFGGPVLASHNNCRALVAHQRQFSDDQLQALIARDGVSGVACDCWMLDPLWSEDRAASHQITLAALADHVDHICQLAGSSRHAAIGSDLDGGFGREQSPRDLDTIADLQALAGILAGRGYAAEDVANVMHGNWLRLLRRSLPA
jgi:membrane dipeptidase